MKKSDTHPKRKISQRKGKQVAVESAPFLLHAFVPLLIFFLSYSFFIYDFTPINYPIFDEQHYISTAEQINQGAINENWSQPPLGKAIIGAGIKIFGNNPFGWRAMSLIFTSLSMVAIYFLGLTIFGDLLSAIFVVFLTLFNQLSISFSRMAMLDPFMFFFMITSLVLTSYSISSKKAGGTKRWLQILAGLCVGLAGACKWYGWTALIPCIWILNRPLGQAKGIGLKETFKVLILPTILAYTAAFLIVLKLTIPLQPDKVAEDKVAEEKSKDQISYTKGEHKVNKEEKSPIPSATISHQSYRLSDLIPLHLKMARAQTGFHNPNHLGSSNWFSWPIMTSPVWFKLPEEEKRPGSDSLINGVAFLGNPAIIWGGLFAILICIWSWKYSRSKQAEWILAIYLPLLLSFAIIPRTTGYFYYYYPAAIMLGFAIVYAFKYLKSSHYLRMGYLILCIGLFVTFKPIIYGQKIPAEQFDRLLWFKSWLWDQRFK
jgi:dolichyl-phosphate-mannose-protein mannosyltransferase